MLTPQHLLRVIIELIFILLGGLIVWLGLTGKVFFVAQPVPWMIVSIALILWGLRALYTRGRWTDVATCAYGCDGDACRDCQSDAATLCIARCGTVQDRCG